MISNSSVHRNPSFRVRGPASRFAMFLVLFMAFGSLSYCSSVQFSYLRHTYAKKEKLTLKRIALAMEPSAAYDSRANGAVLTLVRDFMSVQRDYIIYPLPRTSRVNPPWKDYCTANPKLNGVLWHNIRVLEHYKESRKTDIGILATLYDCKSGERIWQSYARDDFDSEDDDLKTVIASYSNRVGTENRYLIAPTYLLVRDLFDSLPNPVLTEKEKDEKIDLME